ncbi:MAG: M28 family peptidase [Phycisphaeraceae bacterium]|nr:M28 family peptidase [Phycisphaeraceae bacterium]
MTLLVRAPWRISILAGVVATLCAAAIAAPATDATIERDIALYREHIFTLANPYYEGRGSGSRGNRLAADYLEFYYRRAGLTPAFTLEETAADGTTVTTPFASYRQSFSVGRGTVVQREALSVSGGGDAGARTFIPGQDFNALAITGSGTIEAEAVFVGYSIEDGPDDYSTYAQAEPLDGRIAIVMRFEPMDETGRSRFVDEGGPRWSAAAALRPKLQAAIDRGAGAIILVNPPGADDPRAGNLETVQTSQGFGRPMGVPVVMMSQRGADDLVRAADARGRGLMDLRRLADEGGGVHALARSRVRIDVSAEQAPKITENLGGILPGRGELASQYVILGAHMDHVGFGHDGGANPANVGQLHPGADDNASGTSAVLIAMNRVRDFFDSAPAGQPLRSVLFMHFSGEEIGLLGSRHFVRNNTFNARDIYAMINMDMVGRVRNNLVDLNGTGTAKGFEEWLDPIIARSPLSVRKLPGGQGPSDHQSFYNAQIPVIFFFSGFHPDYHAPGDTPDKINIEGAVQVAALASDIVFNLAARQESLEFQPTTATFGRLNEDERPGGPPARTGRGGRARGDQPAPPPPPAADAQPDRGPSMAAMRVRFGIRPGYDETEPGVLVEGVSEGGSAAAAGLKEGDRMIKWNGKAIADIRGWMELLAAHNAGDEVEVTIVRDGTERVIKAKLQGVDREVR